jgi:hypothetical protein
MLSSPVLPKFITAKLPDSLAPHLTSFPFSIFDSLCFQSLAHSFVVFCTHQNHNPFQFKRFRTLCQKHPGGGGVIFKITSQLESSACPEHLGVTRHKSLSLLECADPQNAPVSSLECAVPKTGRCKPFRMRSCKKSGGEGLLWLTKYPMRIFVLLSPTLLES